MALNQEKHVAFVATINCFLNLKSINKIVCQGMSYPVDKCLAVNAWLTLDPEDDVRFRIALKKFTRNHFSGGYML